jgi:hypothetical protein
VRADMAKVVTERPRSGHDRSSKKTGLTLSKDQVDADDHGAMWLKMSRLAQYGRDAKQFTDLIGPLRRYLRKQVGRRWDDIFSEMCQHLDRRT